ncbi:Protein SWT-1 [Aphelenchoides avenae]|nr:Protein SWT-1 [Aphelenchus avenae]
MITVNAVGVSLMFLYLMFYICYTPAGKRRSILLQTGAVFTLIAGMLVLVQLYGTAVLDPLGFVSMTFNIINFGAPLAGMRVVLRKKCCDSLPLPLCTANLLVSSQWCLYGVLIHDIYIIVPNGVGVMLAIIQLSLFLIFPRMPGGSAPFSSCCPCGISRMIPSAPSRMKHQKSRRRALGLDIGSAPRTSSSLLRTAVLGCATRSDSANTGITSASVPPASPLTTSQALSMSEPELGGPSPDDSPLPTEPILRRPFEFDRIREIDELDRQWSESELQRAQSAPEIPAENS